MANWGFTHCAQWGRLKDIPLLMTNFGFQPGIFDYWMLLTDWRNGAFAILLALGVLIVGYALASRNQMPAAEGPGLWKVRTRALRPVPPARSGRQHDWYVGEWRAMQGTGGALVGAGPGPENHPCVGNIRTVRGGMPGVAQVLVSKYADHLPLFRGHHRAALSELTANATVSAPFQTVCRVLRTDD
jgi:hypothetical protein